MAYLYPFVSEPWKTQQKVHQILNTLYHNNPDGLSGNEDCGQMSAWAVLSAIGFYPVTPGTDYYVIGTPWFNKVTINLENGKTFEIKANGVSANNFYIKSASLNGKNHNAATLKHADIMNGGELVFIMSNQPNKKWGVGEKNEPVTQISDNLIVPAPAIIDATKSFKDKKNITLSGPLGSQIFYNITDADGTTTSQPYTAPFTIDNTSTIQIYAQNNGSVSSVVKSEFVKMTDDKDIKLTFEPANQYSSGGANNLVDGIRCSPDFRIGGWLGFEKVNLEAIIDLRQIKQVSTFGAGFFQDINAWIFFPSKIEFFVSDNGTDYRSVKAINNDVPLTQEGGILKTFEVQVKPVNARFVKMIATNIGNCPPGHKGNGGPAWIFSDEIIVK